MLTDRHECRRLLIVRGDVLGDIVLTLPMIHHIHRELPDIHITVLCSPIQASVLANVSINHDRLPIDTFSADTPSSSRTLKRDIATLRSFNFDAIILANHHPYIFKLAYKAGIPIRIGDGERLLDKPRLTHPVSLDNRSGQTHEIENMCRLAVPITGSMPTSFSFGFSPDPAQKQPLIDRLIKQNNGQPLTKPLITIHPGMGKGNRCWPATAYASLIDKLMLDYHVVLSGHGNDESIITSILSQCRHRPMSLLNQLTMTQLIHLLTMSDGVIGPETGPVHLAGALQTPVVAISPTKFVQSNRWGPLTAANAVLKNPRTCPLPCHIYNRPCQETYCLDTISPTDVYEVAISIIGKRPPSVQSNKQQWANQQTRIAGILPSFSPRHLHHVTTLLTKTSNFDTPIHWVASQKHLRPWSPHITVEKWPRWPWQQIRYLAVFNAYYIVTFTRRSFIWAWILNQLAAPSINRPATVIFMKHAERVTLIH